MVNREGIPIAHEVWEGNIKDPKTVPDTLHTLTERFHLKRCVFVGDNAMTTPENIALLREQRCEYIMSLKLLKDARALRILKDPALPSTEQFAALTDIPSASVRSRHRATAFTMMSGLLSATIPNEPRLPGKNVPPVWR